ncbi:FAD-dependent oxidoreductase [Pseudomonas sp. X10]
MSQVREVDFVVIGAGISEPSAAAYQAARGSVLLLETEDHPGNHSTGHSAALISELHGNAVERRLTRASRSFPFKPPAGFAAPPLVTPRETLFFGTAGQLDLLERLHQNPYVAARTWRAAPVPHRSAYNPSTAPLRSSMCRTTGMPHAGLHPSRSTSSSISSRMPAYC